MTVPTLRTGRLTLCALRPQDARVMTKALNNLAVSRWLSVVPFPYGITDAEWFINENINGKVTSWAIWAGADFVGVIGLDDGLGYWVAQPAWGKGYATEAGLAVLAHYFAVTDADDIVSAHFAGNTASQNVLTKLGFQDHGEKSDFSKARNAPVAGRMMRLTRARWDSLQGD